MFVHYYLFDIILILTLKQINSEKMLTCELDKLDSCPVYSVCSSTLECTCLQGFHLNPNWSKETSKQFNQIVEYCLPLWNTTDQMDIDNKFVVFLRSPAKGEKLLFSLLMIILTAIMFMVVICMVKFLKPIKRTRAVYKIVKNKRQSKHILNESDELDLQRHYDIELQEINRI
uniref:EB domain-containing protein n=1 Tax=Glossina brevipalpis TaxID=37001 RepID=A0A1A9X1U7_9MUSC